MSSPANTAIEKSKTMQLLQLDAPLLKAPDSAVYAFGDLPVKLLDPMASKTLRSYHILVFSKFLISPRSQMSTSCTNGWRQQIQQVMSHGCSSRTSCTSVCLGFAPSRRRPLATSSTSPLPKESTHQRPEDDPK
eukprot:4173833-Amphidinium_carterae.1